MQDLGTYILLHFLRTMFLDFLSKKSKSFEIFFGLDTYSGPWPCAAPPIPRNKHMAERMCRMFAFCLAFCKVERWSFSFHQLFMICWEACNSVGWRDEASVFTGCSWLQRSMWEMMIHTTLGLWGILHVMLAQWIWALRSESEACQWQIFTEGFHSSLRFLQYPSNSY